MYVISLWQPYAQLIADEVKRAETRHWAPPDWLIGDRIAIHAGKRQPTRKELTEEFPNEVHKEMTQRYGTAWTKTIPYGALVAIARLDGFIQITSMSEKGFFAKGLLTNQEFTKTISVTYPTDSFGHYTVGRYIWQLNDIYKLKTPQPELGQQGWWKLESDRRLDGV